MQFRKEFDTKHKRNLFMLKLNGMRKTSWEEGWDLRELTYSIRPQGVCAGDLVTKYCFGKQGVQGFPQVYTGANP